jgi:hypothetical protein
MARGSSLTGAAGENLGIGEMPQRTRTAELVHEFAPRTAARQAFHRPGQQAIRR